MVLEGIPLSALSLLKLRLHCAIRQFPASSAATNYVRADSCKARARIAMFIAIRHDDFCQKCALETWRKTPMVNFGAFIGLVTSVDRGIQ